jgi:hypothetical protein
MLSAYGAYGAYGGINDQEIDSVPEETRPENHPSASCKKKRGKEETEASVKGLVNVKARIVQAYMIFEEKGNDERQ